MEAGETAEGAACKAPEHELGSAHSTGGLCSSLLHQPGSGQQRPSPVQKQPSGQVSAQTPLESSSVVQSVATTYSQSVRFSGAVTLESTSSLCVPVKFNAGTVTTRLL